MVSTFLGFAILITLALAMLPVPRVRRLLLTGSARLVQAIVLAFLGACGTFFVQPQSAPDWATAALHPILEGTRGLLPASAASVPGLPWLVLAIMAVGIGLPVLIVIELTAGLACQSTLVQSLRKELRAAADWFDRRLAMLGITGPALATPVNEAQHASEALRTGRRPTPNSNAPLVLDLLKK